MLKLLLHIFVKDAENSPAARRAYGTVCGLYGIFLNLMLFAGKYLAGLLSGSVAITADAFNNLSDAGSSIIMLIGFALAGKKPDLAHPFGHGRVEYLTGLMISVIIMVVGIELGKGSLESIITPHPIEAGALPAVILAVSIAVKLYMCLYNRRIGKKINSAAMQAASTDSLSDAAATSAVLIAIAVSSFFNVNIDGWIGLFVSLFILYAGYRAAKDTISPLLGQAPDPELVKSIEKTVLSHSEICGIHDLIIHDYGPGRVMASIHAEVNGYHDIYELHDAIDMAEGEIREKLGVLTIIHMDPIEADNSEVAQMRHELAEKLKEVNDRITIHDLRMVPGPTHTNLIFDALVPADCKISDEQLAEDIRNIVNSTWENHFAVVHIDRSFV